MNRTIRILCCVIAVVIVYLLLFNEANAVPRNRTLIIAQGFDPYHLWPNASTASTNLNCGAAIVEPVFWTDPRTGKDEGLLVESWKMISNTAWQLKLRKGVFFTNGEPMNADAAKFSVEIFMDKQIAPAYTRSAAALKSVEKVDEYTINIHTKAPYPAMLTTLSELFIVPPKYWNEIGGGEGYTKKPVGTGPFVLTEWKKDDRLVMDKNEKYWGRLPKGIDQVIWKPIPDDTARAAGLETGEFDLIASMSVNSVPRIQANPNLNLISVQSIRVYSCTMSMLEKDSSPLLNKKVRQALNYAVDKESIVKNIFMGKAKALQGQVLYEGVIGFHPLLKPYPYDPEKAKKMLAEAGYPNGFEIPFKYPAGRFAQDKEVAEAVAGMLAKIGVKCKMIQLEGGEYLKQLVSNTLGSFSFGGTAPKPEPHSMYSLWRSDWRYTRYQNPEVDKLIDAGMIEMDLKKREKIYQKIAEIMYDDCPELFLYQGVDFYGTTKRLKNWMPTNDQRINLYGISLEN